MFSKILVAFDGSPMSWKALRTGVALARLETGAELTVVSVEERLPHMPEVVDEFSEEKARQNAIFEQLQKEALQLASEQGINLKVNTIAGHAAQSIVRFAEQGGYDLLVIGHSGRSGVWGSFLGSTADKIVRHAKCPVLVMR